MFIFATWGLRMMRVLPVVLIMTSVASICSCLMPMRFIAFCMSRGFMPGIIASPNVQQGIAIGIKNNHNDHHHAGKNDNMAWLEAELAVVLVKIADEADHARRHLDFVVATHGN